MTQSFDRKINQNALDHLFLPVKRDPIQKPTKEYVIWEPGRNEKKTSQL